MCGIAGTIGPAGRLPEMFDRDALRHRGPDGYDERTGSIGGLDWALQHWRLAINDLSDAGRQPMASADDSIQVVYNGEIYNYPELRQRLETKGHRFRSDMDGEVIVHLWEDAGPDALRSLNGIFAIAVIDHSRRRCYLARDPVGVKPLFWSSAGGVLRFASEPEVLECGQGEDVVAIAQFLTFLWVPAPRTRWAGIAALRPGELLEFDPGDGRHHIRRYRSPMDDARDSATETGAGAAGREVLAGRTRELIKAAVERQLLSDVPVGLMASGGMDSTFLWAAAAGRLEAAYTIDWSGDTGGERLDEDARTVSRLAAEQYPESVVWIPGAGIAPDRGRGRGSLFADPAYDLTQAIAASARGRGTKVLLSGQGGDELFAGYRRHAIARLLDVAPDRARRLLGRMLAVGVGRGISGEYAARAGRALQAKTPFESYLVLCSYSTAAERARILDSTEREVADEVVWQEHAAVWDSGPPRSVLRRALDVDLSVYLPGLGLSYVDRAAMAESVEARVPILDLDLVGWMQALPDGALMPRLRGKTLQRAAARGVLPDYVINRRKRGFAMPAERLPTAGPTAEVRQSVYLRYAQGLLTDQH